MTRKPLRSVELTGPRAIIRRTGFVAIAALALVAAVGYLLPAHRLENAGYFHSNAADGGPLPIMALSIVIVAVLLLRKLRLGAGIVAGVLAAGGAFASVAPVVLAHMFRTPDFTYGEHIFMVGVLGLFFGGIAFAIAEPILYVLERRSVERASRPAPLPMAIATSA
jgi:hypothetical protein